MERVIAYVDGFNLYYGLRDAGWRRFYWLDVRKLCQNLLRPPQQLQATRYFSARISLPASKRDRQARFLEALEAMGDIDMQFGVYRVNPRTCNKCGYVGYVPKEKMTDVNIAVAMMADAFQKHFDTALLVSGDGDLAGLVREVRLLFPNKRVIAAFPPERFNSALKDVASAYMNIGHGTLKKSQLPEKITKPDGFILRRPRSWR